MNLAHSITKLSALIIGEEGQFSFQERLFHRICIALAGLLNGVLIAAIFLNLWEIVAFTVICEILLTLAYWLSRVMGAFQWAYWIVVIGAHAALVANFFLNAGSHGATIFLSFFSLSFLFAISKAKINFVWTLTHIVLLVVLVLLEPHLDTNLIRPYPNATMRSVDFAISLPLTLFFTSLIFHFSQKTFQERRMLIKKQKTALEEQKLALSKSNEDLTKVLSIISHDVRNPLAALEGFLDFQSSGELSKKDEEELRAQLQSLLKNTNKMLDDLVNWSKTKVHGEEINIQELTLGSWLTDTVSHMESLAAAKGIHLFSDYPGNERHYGDPNLMSVVIRNLLQNAIKFTPRGGQIDLKANFDNESLKLSVSDTGVGMSKEQIDEVFTLSKKVGMGTQKEKGSGLGLLICEEYVKLHKGSMQVVSEPGKGSTFSVIFPRQPLNAS